VDNGLNVGFVFILHFLKQMYKIKWDLDLKEKQILFWALSHGITNYVCTRRHFYALVGK
jgi:hypothetical protein